MKEHPILFSTDMVKALLEGRKTQTRRVIKLDLKQHWFDEPILDDKEKIRYCPYGQVGDRLWVREIFKYIDFDLRDAGKLPHRTKIEYKSDGFTKWVTATTDTQIVIPDKWRPSIFMPRWASRITLEITGIRVQRVQEICLCDIEAEGIPDDRATYNAPLQIAKYQNLWDSINGKKYPWESNPWVWVIEFKHSDTPAIHTPPVDAGAPDS
jgi:hypothetical protein